MYQLPWYEVTVIVVVVALVIVGISYLFFDNFWGVVGLIIPYVILLRQLLEERKEKRMHRAVMEFKDFLEGLSGNLYAGVSLENSFVNSYSQLKCLYQEAFVIDKVLLEGVERIQNHIPIENVLLQLAEETEIEEVWDFVALATVAKKNGGNLIKIIRQATDHIKERIQLEQEIVALIAAKKLEQRIMCAMPFIMMLYMKITSPGYFDVLYHNPIGILFMGACLLIIFSAYELGARIIKMTL